MLKTNVRGTAAAVALAMLSAPALPAGLGKLTVFSGIGQPLRAEVELNATREELATLTARLASQDAFKSAGIEYSPALSAVRFQVDKRPDGKPVIRLSSDRPMNEPFIDLLLELNWANGRLAREYTFLLDPVEPPSSSSSGLVALPESGRREVIAEPQVPVGTAPAVESRAAAAPAAVAPPAAPPPAPVAVAPAAPAAVEAPAPRPAPAAPAVTAEQAPAPVTQAAEPVARRPRPDTRPAVQRPAPARAEAADTGASGNKYKVAPGDTLYGIARETRPEDVSLDQMLVALYRGNPAAFLGKNMNRLKAGRILSVPDREAVLETSPAEARRVVVAQTSDWANYRRKLAQAAVGTAPKEAAVGREAGGKITAKVEDRGVPSAPRKDELKVSKSEAAARGAGAGKDSQNRVTALEEDLVAKDKALKEAQSRVTDLEKNVKDLEGLLKLKNEQLAKLETAGKAGGEVKDVPPAKPVEAPAKVEGTRPADGQPTAEAQQPKPPVVTPPPAPPADKPKPPVAPVEPATAEEPSFIDGLLENPAALAGGAGALALLLGGYAWYKTRRRQEEEPVSEALTGEPSIAQSSVFGDTGGRSVDTTGAQSMQSGFSQQDMTNLDADEVDPVAEADVYIAYGRDAQAEEILLEALQKDPSRHAVHLKLLEIYAARKSVKQFEGIATELYSRTGGSGPDWERAAAMGLQLDPANPLYGGQAPVSAESFETAAGQAADDSRETWTMPGNLQHVTDVVEPAKAAPSERGAIGATIAKAGGIGATLAAAGAAVAEKAKTTAKDVPFLDLDFGSEPKEVKGAASGGLVSDIGTDFALEPSIETVDFGADKTVMDANFGKGAGAVEDHPLDFEFSLDEPVQEAARPTPSDSGINLADIRLDLDETDFEATGGEAGAAAGDLPEVTTKLELARAYDEMGDKEGARELLQEVMKEGSASQKDKARALLESLG